MVVGVCRIELHLPNEASLKGKRKIIKSMKDRIKSRFNISIAEVDHHDLWQRAVLGVACVGHEQFHVREVLDRVVAVVEGNPMVEVIQCDLNVL